MPTRWLVKLGGPTLPAADKTHTLLQLRFQQLSKQMNVEESDRIVCTANILKFKTD